MCGFAGEFLFDAHGRADLDLAVRMAERLVHRGPDDAGRFLSADGRCAIGFRRLAVIDPAGSRQPMTTPDGRCTLAFNGEIYNYLELRDLLKRRGAAFRTAGDTEVLLTLLDQRGQAALGELDGMFALAFYDSAAGQLLLARDAFGEKPLWYAELADRIVFASEAKALLVHPRVSRAHNPLALTQYLSFGYSPAPLSAFAGLGKLQPGRCVLAGPQGLSQPHMYASWLVQLSSQPPADDAAAAASATGRPGELCEQLRDRLAVSVRRRMLSDVPLGALLSGGLDSAVTVAMMTRAAGASGGVRTFTAGFEDARYDERPAAAAIAKHLGTDHTELVIAPRQEDLDDIITRIVEQYDEPFGDSSALPTYLICRQARQHVTVALTGDGGDELFAGYDRYRALRLAQRCGPGAYLAVRLAAALARPLAGTSALGRLRRFVRFADELHRPYAEQYLHFRSLFTPAELPRIAGADLLADGCPTGPAEWFCDLFEAPDVDDEVLRAQLHDLSTYLPDDVLVKTDIASMASSLELRTPMLNCEVALLGLSLPTELKLSARAGKLLLRRAFAGLLPPDTLRGRKRGFGLPIGAWLRQHWSRAAREILLDSNIYHAGILNQTGVQGLLNDHLGGRADHGQRLWALMILCRWWSTIG